MYNIHVVATPAIYQMILCLVILVKHRLVTDGQAHDDSQWRGSIDSRRKTQLTYMAGPCDNDVVPALQQPKRCFYMWIGSLQVQRLDTASYSWLRHPPKHCLTTSFSVYFSLVYHVCICTCSIQNVYGRRASFMRVTIQNTSIYEPAELRRYNAYKCKNVKEWTQTIERYRTIGLHVGLTNPTYTK